MSKDNGRGFSLFNKLMRKAFFVKLIMTTALIAIIPNLASNVVAYYKVSRTFEQETGSNKLQYLNQTINAIDIVLNRIKENSNLLALNQSFQEFEKFPNGSYYEGLQGEIPPEDLPALYGYLEAKKNAFLTINSFRLSNEFVDSAYFYDKNKNLVITSENDGSNRQFMLDAFYDKGWYDTLANASANAVFMETRIAKQYQSAEKSILSVIYKSNKGGNALIVNLDAAVIYSEIINKLNHQDEIYVVSSTGNILFESQPSATGQPLSLVLPGHEQIVGKSGSLVAELNKSQMLVSYSTSPLLNWTFVSASDMEALSAGTASIKRTILLSAVLLVLFSVTLAYLSSRSLYKPISRLSTLITGKLERKSGHTDEIHFIGNFVQSTMDERDFYKEKLEESLPFYREQFKYSLLHRHSLTIEEIEEKKAYLGLDFASEELVVLLLALEDGSNRMEERSMRTSDLYKIQVIDIVKKCHAIRTRYFLVDSEKDKIAMVLNCSGIDQQQVFRIAQHVLDDVNFELQSRFTIGVGRRCATVQELPQAYEEALEALKYRIIYGKGYVISIDDIMIDSESEFIYPKQKEELLLGHIKTAREPEAHQLFDEIVAEINTHKNKLHYNQIMPMFMQLLTGFMNTYSQLGADASAVFGNETDPYRELLDQNSMDKISRWFHQLIHLTTVYIEKEMKVKGNQHITKVVDILEREYSQDISLNSVAEQLNLNPAYISRLFKQITGQPFVDYLKRVRIEKSKELLAQSDLKINEIGKQVGYGNSYYFIKVFKEMIGLTPGEYKKLYGS
ncbi:helix-turn-helix domain-containing protein [Paenibacillus piri]|uniref:Helix-turn-helix domain-containing protein n=1 Tax=Paenibacillus piri TaxID=2547395 RepID=A0A4R5KXJ0_9BACL|nr:helix-turn-helix domain-containing protein [Paenibacillus piri]TDG00782.1 helix-turn-helix domain-containing protein [Paenibacillus piri]